LPTFILDPFDFLEKVFHVNYIIPSWIGYVALGVGWSIAMVLTYHEVRKKNIQKTGLNWIEAYETKNHQLPPLPNYMLELFRNYIPSDPISKGMEPIQPSGQKWNSLLPIRRYDLCILWEWLGEDPNDFLSRLRMAHPTISLDLGDGKENGWKQS
jgi:hypothetical protein